LYEHPRSLIVNPVVQRTRSGVMATAAGRSGNSTLRTLSLDVAEIQSALRQAGVRLADVRGAQALELVFAGVPELGMPTADGRVDEIERFEQAPVAARLVPPARGRSRLRYFLDGSQRTLQVWRLGLVPIAATVASAAILRRDESGRVEVAPGTLRFKHAWLIPTRAPEPGLDALVDLIASRGGAIVDPLADRPDDEYAMLAGDYAKLIQAAYVAARHVREELERDLISAWGAGLPLRESDEWLVADGRLRLPVPNAVGLVKSLSQQHLTGPEAVTLFDLPPGHRTSAFRARDYRRDPGTGLDPEIQAASGKSGAPTLWFLRLRDSSGLDARHALVRVEAGPDVRATDEIDELSAWLLAERSPRATEDARWATLLYPIHLLEEILKRRVEAHTRGWPVVR
jgi:hypothetical protein